MSSSPPIDATSRLRLVVEQIAAGHRLVARQELRLLLAEISREGRSDAMRYYVFGAALAHALSDEMVEHVSSYLRGFDVPQIDLFDLLGRHAPWVALATGLAIDAIAQLWRDAAAAAVQAEQEAPLELPPDYDREWEHAGMRAALVDVGVGAGRQVVALLRTLSVHGELTRYERIDIVGIEPRSWSLKTAAERIRRCADELGLGPKRVRFHPICARAESLTLDEWRYVRALCGGVDPVINASFSLQNVPSTAARIMLLQQWVVVEPLAVLITECDTRSHTPDSEASLAERFDHAWHYFGECFAALERAHIDDRDRTALQVCYFGREAIELLAAARENDDAHTEEDGARTLFYEPAAAWCERLERIGFVPGVLPAGQLVSSALAHGLRAEVSEPGLVRLGTPQIPLTAVICASLPDTLRASLHAPTPPVPSMSMITRIDSVPHPIDVRTYLTALVAVARADQIVHDAEREFIERQAHLLFTPLELSGETPSIDEILANPEKLDPRTRRAIVRDLVFLARIDGEYHAEERALLVDITQRLGYDLAWLDHLERLATVPDLLTDLPSWFQEYWFLTTK